MIESNLYKIIDNYLPVSDYESLQNHCKNTQYNVNESDIVGETATDKAVSNLDITDPQLKQLFPTEIEGKKLWRAYINYYAPNVPGNIFHRDSEKPDDMTLLYYPCPTYDINEGGATELIICNEILGVRYKANRCLIFKSNILHRATSFQTKQRFTFALKYI